MPSSGKRQGEYRKVGVWKNNLKIKKCQIKENGDKNYDTKYVV